jgi:flagellar secretion chaperone FliS
MFASAGYASARKSYANAEIGARVEAASPHELIAVLFEELLKNLDTLGVGLSANGTMTRAAAIQRRSRVNTIIIGLEASLNHNQGGEIAGGLLAIYREARRLIGEGVTAGDPKPVIEARGMIAEIADAWSQIG